MSKEIKTGIVAVIIIALFIWGFNFLKGQDLLNAGTRHFYVEYDNIQGLNEASAVTINGLKVGKVVDIKFNSNPSKKGELIVELMLDNDFQFSKNSIAKVYSSSIMGGQSLAIIPSYDGDKMAVSGDYLIGETESDIFSTVGERLNPLQKKIENIIVSADTLMVGLNHVLNRKSRKSLQNTILGLETTVSKMNNTITSLSKMIDSSKENIEVTLANTKKITDNFAKISDTLVNANLGMTIKKIEATLQNVNSIIAGIEQGKGTLGKLLNDDKMYINLTNASKEMEELLREMKLHPKRFVHFSLFGKKAKAYKKEEKKEVLKN